MKRISIAALVAVSVLGACATPELPGRMATGDMTSTGPVWDESYTPEVVGARAENDFMRFSTMSIPH